VAFCRQSYWGEVATSRRRHIESSLVRLIDWGGRWEKKEETVEE